MAPTIGPKEAPIMPNTLGSWAAHLASGAALKGNTAIRMLTIAPMPTDTNGLTFGSVVLKLLAAMNEEKQALGKAAMVRAIISTAKSPGASLCCNAAVIWVAEGSMTPAALAPATAMIEIPAVKIIAM